MNKKEVIELIGKENWKEFLEFMKGQTVGVNSDGSTDYYDEDVKRFKAGSFYGTQWD